MLIEYKTTIDKLLEGEVMTYQEVLSAIHSRKTFSSTASLDRIRRLMERLGNPQDSYKTVHVAGTNGKGSVCALTESALRAAGYRVGLFTSPYLVDFRERIQINRELISEAALISCYERVMDAETELEAAGFEPVNEFELVTALGFTAFAQAQADWAVIEVGLGGRADATNVLRRPEICCITSISLDHTAVLGDTVGQIAGEKAGIIKPGVPVVLARQDPEAQKVLEEKARQIGAEVIPVLSWSVEQADVSGQTLVTGTEKLRIPLLGDYQRDNAAAAWEICRRIGLEQDAIRWGFSCVGWPGRLQYVPGKPDMLIDAGHNPAGISALCRCLESLFSGRSIIGVMSMMADKDHGFCVPEIARRCRLLIGATTGLPRSLSPEALTLEAAPYCRTAVSGTIPEAVSMARDLARPGDLILVCGSVYGAGAAQLTI